MATCLAVQGQVLPSVGEANAIPLEKIAEPIDFAFTGTVLRVENEFITFTDGSDGTILFHNTAEHGLELWDSIFVKGKMTIADNDKTRRFLSEEAHLLGKGIRPQTLDVSAKEINDGSCNFRLVRTRGVVASLIADEVAPGYRWAQLKTADGNCYVTIFKDALSQIEPGRLIDAETEFTGIVMPIPGVRMSLGSHLLVYECGSIKIAKPPVENPFSKYPLSENQPSLHRQYISGDVVATDSRDFFLRTKIGRIIKVYPSSGTPVPELGENVVVAGFPAYTPYWLCLSEAIVKKNAGSSRPLETPTATTIAELFRDASGLRKFKTNSTGHRLILKGKVVAAANDELELSDGTNSVFVEIGKFRNVLSPFPEIGSMIEVTGLCWTEFSQKTNSDIFPSFLRFKLYPFSAEDVRILEFPPWWTPLKFVTLIGILVAVLVGLGIWNFMLNKKAERRGKRLYEERIGHALAKHKVEERTHLAIELHDSISQTLTGVALHLDGGETATAKTLLASCREELRHCIWDLRSRTFEEKDMAEAIERTIAPHLSGIKADIKFNVSRNRISESIVHAVLRIIRELVVNAIHHGGARHISINGEYDGKTLSFSVKDDGCGFDPDSVPGPELGHFGLLGIRERIEYFDGELKIDSSAGTGTAIHVTLHTDEYEDGK
jgi:hypothetical protein